MTFEVFVCKYCNGHTVVTKTDLLQYKQGYGATITCAVCGKINSANNGAGGVK